ncbi:MAG TPA: hypothetical protein VM032_19035 [Vicinamibacterales bacterium]|nr:hypothetical protein [Vicinamibacterales bacterium]
MRIELVIDELILHGFDPRHRHAIGDAVQEALTRVLAERWPAGASSAPVVVPRLDAGSLRVESGWSPAHIGREVATALAAVLSRPSPVETAAGGTTPNRPRHRVGNA